MRHGAKPGGQSSGSWIVNSSASSKSSTPSTSFCTPSTSSSPLRFAHRTTRSEVGCLHGNDLCYSFPVTRVPPNGLRASAPARSHGCGVTVRLPCNSNTTGAFPHKIQNETGLSGFIGLFHPADPGLPEIRKIGRVRPSGPWGFRATGLPISQFVVKEGRVLFPLHYSECLRD